MTARPRSESLLEPPGRIDPAGRPHAGALPTVEPIETDQGLADLKEIWERLHQKGSSPNPFLTWGWISSWWRHFGRGKKLQLLLVRAGGLPVGIAPFYIASGRIMAFPFRRLSFLGDEGVGSDHLDLLSEKGFEERVAEAVVAHWQTASRRWDVIRLRGISESSLHLPHLTRALGSGWKVDLEADQVCPYLPLPSAWDDYLKTLSGSMRYTIRRKIRSLEKEHEIEFITLKGAEESRAGIDDLMALHRKRWDATGGSDAFLTETKEKFHREAADYLFERGIARIYLLKADRRTVASLYGFSLGGTFFYYQAGFDPDWGGKSVGLALMAKSIEAAISQGWREYDFLQGSEGYKSHWTSRHRKTWRASFFPPGFQNRIVRFLIRSEQRARKTARRAIDRMFRPGSRKNREQRGPEREKDG